MNFFFSPEGINMPPFDPLTPRVLELLKKETGLDDKEAWTNIFLLTSKAEADNDDAEKAFMSDKKGVNMFGWSSRLSYDGSKRGLTINSLIGYTTHHNGKPDGDAQQLFKIFRDLGGEDLSDDSKECDASREAASRLSRKIQDLQNDSKWIRANWTALCRDGGYIRETMKAWNAVGVERPSALAIATVFDCSLNQGHDGKDGGCVNLKKLAVKGNEDETLKNFNAWRRKVAGTNDYNSPPSNGKHRADQYEKLRDGKCYSLLQCRDKIQKAISWEMK